MSFSRSNEVPPHCRTGQPGSDELLEGPLVPRVGAVLVEDRRGALDQVRRQDRLAAGRAIHRRDRHAPRPLARDAPVGTVRQHVEDPVAAPRRDPPDVPIDGLQAGLPQRAALGAAAAVRRGALDERLAIHADEPLRRRQEDHRVVAAPAVRIRMGEILPVPELRPLLERLLDARVRVEDLLAAEELDRVEEMAAGADRGVDVQPVAHARDEVVGAMAGSGVHGARPRFERDVVAEHRDGRPRVERMLETDVLQHDALHSRNRLTERASGDRRHRGRQRFRDDHGAAADVVGGVVEFRMKGDRQVGRNRPGCRRPDQHRDVAARELRDAAAQLSRAVGRERELDVDRGGGVILVFDFGLGQRRAAVDAPVHRLLALEHQASRHEPAERPRNGRLVLERHRQIRMLPVAEDAEPLELPGHHVDESLGVGAAGASEIGRAHLALLRPELAVHLQLDRQSVTVVSRHVRRIEPRHRP